MNASRCPPSTGAAGGTLSVQNSPVPGGPTVARCLLGPIVRHAPRCPIYRLAPLLLRFTRKPGISVKRRLNWSGIPHMRLTSIVSALRSAAVESLRHAERRPAAVGL
jgi:hypothetical protein